MDNVSALKALYAALGGTASDVADATTIVEVLNAIAVLLGGEGGATLNPDAIANIAAVAPVTPTTQNVTVTPSTSEQEITADSGKVLGTVTVEAVTASIDANIIAANIKSGVTILGVEGTYTGE
jgi:hypothetical protein